MTDVCAEPFLCAHPDEEGGGRDGLHSGRAMDSVRVGKSPEVVFTSIHCKILIMICLQ